MRQRATKIRLPDDSSRKLQAEMPAVRATGDRSTVWLVSGLLVLAVAFIFGKTVLYDFVNFDDDMLVYENRMVQRGMTWEGAAWASTTCMSSMWYPLTWISYMLDSQVYGLKPWGYHLTNVLLHAGTTVILFWALWRMTGNLWASALATLLFAIHPLRAEAVAWVGERKSPLSGLFFVATIAAYVEYARRPFSLARYLAVAGLFTLGLLAKPTLVTLPFVLLLLDYWPLRRLEAGRRVREAGEAASDGALREPVENKDPSSQGFDPLRNAPSTQRFAPRTLPAWRLVVEKIPLLLLSVACCVAAVVSQGRNVASIQSMPISARVANSLVSYAVYLGQFFWPVGLAAFYPRSEDLPVWQVAGACLLLTLLSVGALLLWRRQPALLVGWLWYLGALVPMIGLVQIGAHARADRYTYLPDIGLCIALVWGARWIVQRLWGDPRSRRWAYGLGGGLLAAGYMACAWQQTGYWKNSETLWTHALACTSYNPTAHNNLGLALAARGAVDEAIVEYEKALEFKPGDETVNNNLGLALGGRGQVDEAIAHYQKSLESAPDAGKAGNGLGAAPGGTGEVPLVAADLAGVHNNLGAALAIRGRIDEAMAHYRKALKFNANYAEAHNNFGSALAGRGEIDEAIAHFQKTLEIKPDHAEARNNLGLALAGRGQIEEAIADYRKALAIKPDYAEAHNNLGTALAGRGRFDEAIAHFRKALEIKPDYAEAHNNLGAALAAVGRMDEAFAHYRKALEVNPDFLAAHMNFGDALAGRGDLHEALDHYQKALGLASAHSDRAVTDVIRARIGRCKPVAAPGGSR